MGRPDKFYLETRCLIGHGAKCCRYLVADHSGMLCAKLKPDLKAVLDFRVGKGSMVARGDNCPGLPDIEKSEDAA